MSQDNELRRLKDELRGIGEDLQPDIMQLIGNALEIEIQRWKARAPVDSGDLRDSIQKRLIDQYTWGVEFLEYGLFQNFGVIGINNQTTQYGVANFVSDGNRPLSGDKYKFKTPRWGVHYTGIEANPWFARTDAQLDAILQRVADTALESIQL